MAWFLLLLLGVSLADEAQQSCHLLQTNSQWRKKGQRGQRADLGAVEQATNLSEPVADKSKGICVPKLSEEEIKAPIEEVVASYGEDGWCTYGFLGGWASECALGRRNREAKSFAKEFEPMYQKYLPDGPIKPKTEVTLKFLENQSLTIRDHLYPLDDLYCYVNGWYSLDRDQLLNNFTYLEEMSEKSCKHLEETMPHYHKVSMQTMLMESAVDGGVLFEIMNGPTSGQVPDHIVHGMYVHAAAKCLLRGGGRGAVCDIANCAARGCLRGNELLYTQRGECQKLT